MQRAAASGAFRDEVDGRVPEGVRERHTRFVTCDVCRRVFWEGSHWKRMRERIDALADASRARDADRRVLSYNTRLLNRINPSPWSFA